MAREFLFNLFEGLFREDVLHRAKFEEELRRQQLRRARKRARTRLNRTWSRDSLNEVQTAKHIELHPRTQSHQITGTSAGFPFQVTGRLSGTGPLLRLQARFRMEYPSLDLRLEVRPHSIPGTEPPFQVLQADQPELVDAYLEHARVALLREACAHKVNLTFTDTHVAYFLNRWTPTPLTLEVEINALTQLVRIITADPSELAQILERPFEVVVETSTTSEGDDDSDEAWLTDEADESEFDSVNHAVPTPSPSTRAFAESSTSSPSSTEIDHAIDHANDDEDTQELPTESPSKVTAALSFDELTAELFTGEATSFAVKERFEVEFCGREVLLTGRLGSVQSFSWDRLLNGVGVKATLQMAPIEHGGMERPVTCVVALPQDRAQALQALVGQNVSGRGTLVALDAFMRRVFVQPGNLAAD
jgi:hypothetical protein